MIDLILVRIILMPNEIQSYNHTRKNIRIPKFELVFTPMVLHVVKH